MKRDKPTRALAALVAEKTPHRRPVPSEVDLLRERVRELEKSVDRLMYPRPQESGPVNTGGGESIGPGPVAGPVILAITLVPALLLLAIATYPLWATP